MTLGVYKPSTAGTAPKGVAKLVHDQVLMRIAGLPPGTMLPSVQQLKREMGVGQETLRRAVAALKSEGWVVVKNGTGTFVGDRSAAATDLQEGGASLDFHAPWIGSSGPDLALLDSSHPKDHSMWNELVTAFNQASHSTRVRIERMTVRERDGALRRGEAVDLITLSSPIERRSRVAASALLLDLAPYVEAFRPELPLYDSLVWDRDPDTQGVLGAGPYVVSCLLAYRREPFKDLGLTWSETPTWDELLDNACRLRQIVGEGKAFCYWGYMPFLLRWGVSLMDPASKCIQFKAPEVEPVLAYLRNLIVRDKVSPLFWSEIHKAAERRAGAIGADYAMTETTTVTSHDERRVGYVPMPVRNRGSDILDIPLICALSHTAYPDECWDFIRFVLSEQGQRIVARHHGGLPVARDISPCGISTEKLMIMRQSASSGRLVYDASIAPYQARFVIERAIEKWLQGHMDLGTLCNHIETRANVLLSRVERTRRARVAAARALP